MTVEQSIDEVKIARTAASGADGQRAGELRLCAGRESRNLFMADMDPFDLALAPDRVGDAVEAIANDAIDTFHADRCQGLGELVCHGFHSCTLSSKSTAFAVQSLSTSTTAWAKACGASCGRLCPMPPVTIRLSYLPVNFLR
jgi:hypothetical protein